MGLNTHASLRFNTQFSRLPKFDTGGTQSLFQVFLSHFLCFSSFPFPFYFPTHVCGPLCSRLVSLHTEYIWSWATVHSHSLSLLNHSPSNSHFLPPSVTSNTLITRSSPAIARYDPTRLELMHHTSPCGQPIPVS